jgi:hypothetical protein
LSPGVDSLRGRERDQEENRGDSDPRRHVIRPPGKALGFGTRAHYTDR